MLIEKIRNFSWLIFFCFVLIFQSCFTSKVLEKAKLDRKPEKVKIINSAYFDSSQFLVINFTAKLHDTKKYLPYNVRLNLDTVVSIYKRSKDVLAYFPDNVVEKSQQIKYIYLNIKEKKEVGICIEYDKSIIKKTFFLKPIHL